MDKLTPWFDAKLHSPSREGCYDCEECNTRHYFKDGRWYRNKKSLRSIPMTIYKMHWRGRTCESLQSMLFRFDPNALRTAEEQAWLDMAPVGHEFGSPEFEGLMRDRLKEAKREVLQPYKFGKVP